MTAGVKSSRQYDSYCPLLFTPSTLALALELYTCGRYVLSGPEGN